MSTCYDLWVKSQSRWLGTRLMIRAQLLEYIPAPWKSKETTQSIKYLFPSPLEYLPTLTLPQFFPGTTDTQRQLLQHYSKWWRNSLVLVVLVGVIQTMIDVTLCKPGHPVIEAFTRTNDTCAHVFHEPWGLYSWFWNRFWNECQSFQILVATQSAVIAGYKPLNVNCIPVSYPLFLHWKNIWSCIDFMQEVFFFLASWAQKTCCAHGTWLMVLSIRVLILHKFHRIIGLENIQWLSSKWKAFPYTCMHMSTCRILTAFLYFSVTWSSKMQWISIRVTPEVLLLIHITRSCIFLPIMIT